MYTKAMIDFYQKSEKESNMEKQTAIELLEKELKDRYPLMNSEPLFEQAKEMEKQQINEAHKLGYDKGYGICEIKFNGLTFKSE